MQVGTGTLDVPSGLGLRITLYESSFIMKPPSDFMNKNIAELTHSYPTIPDRSTLVWIVGNAMLVCLVDLVFRVCLVSLVCLVESV
jgi:hypothetical protein